MINVFEVRETNKMIEESNLDVRTITMGISLLDCCDNNVDVVCEKIYRKITEKAANLVKVGEQIELDYGIPIGWRQLLQDTGRLCEDCQDP